MSPIASYISGYRPANIRQPGGADNSAISKGAANLAGTIGDLAVEAERQVGNAQRLGEFVERKRVMEDGIRNLAADLEKDPDHKTYLDRAKKGIEEIHKQTLAGVNDQALAGHLAQYAEGQRSAFLNGAANESMKKTMQYTAGVLTSDIDSRVKRASDAVDPDSLRKELEGIDAAVVSGTTAGVFTPVQAIAARSNSYALVAQGMVQRGDAVGARAFLSDPRVKEAVDAKDHATLMNAIRPVEAQQLGLTTARELIDANPDAQMIDLDAAAYKALKGRPEAYQHAKSELASLVTMRSAAVKEETDKAEADAYRDVAAVMAQGGVPSTANIAPETWARLNALSPGKAIALLDAFEKKEEGAVKKEATAAFDDVMRVVSSIEEKGKIVKRTDIPSEMWDRLRKADPDKADSILDEIRAEQEHAADRIKAKAEQPSAEQLTTWGRLKLNPKGLNATNLDVLFVRGKINRGQYADLITDQAALRSPKGAAKESSILSDNAIVENVFASAGIVDNKKDQKQIDRFMNAVSMLDVKKKAFKARTGAEPNAEQLKGLARETVADTVTHKGIIWDSKSPAFEAEREKATAALRRAGRPVTDAAIQDLIERKFGVR